MKEFTPKENNNSNNIKYNNYEKINIKNNSEGEDKKIDKNTLEQYSESSPIIATKYAHNASELINQIEKKFYLIIGIACALFVLSIFDFLHMNKLLPFSIDYATTIMLAAFIILLVYIFYRIWKFKKVLDSWSDIFERNSIRASMNIFMSKKSKEEAVIAISETIKEIGEPLRNYILARGKNFKEFLNVPVAINQGNDKIVFDVLIDSDHVIKKESNEYDDKNHSNISHNLIHALKEYGAIIIKIIDGIVTEDLVLSFSKQIYSYISSTKNKHVLAIIIGENSTENANKLAIKLEKKGIAYFVVIEKSTISIPQ
jgi:hypothetical protein